MSTPSEITSPDLFQTGRRFRAWPDEALCEVLPRWIGCQRFIYNGKVGEDRLFAAQRRLVLRALPDAAIMSAISFLSYLPAPVRAFYLTNPPRALFSLVAIWVFGLLAFGLYLQHVVGLEPCPMCVVQRYAMMLVGGCSGGRMGERIDSKIAHVPMGSLRRSVCAIGDGRLGGGKADFAPV